MLKNKGTRIIAANQAASITPSQKRLNFVVIILHNDSNCLRIRFPIENTGKKGVPGQLTITQINIDIKIAFYGLLGSSGIIWMNPKDPFACESIVYRV